MIPVIPKDEAAADNAVIPERLRWQEKPKSTLWIQDPTDPEKIRRGAAWSDEYLTTLKLLGVICALDLLRCALSCVLLEGYKRFTFRGCE